MKTQNILKGTTIFPTINLQAEEIGTQSFATPYEAGSVYNTYKGSFLISVTSPGFSDPFTYLPITDQTAECFSYPVAPQVYDRSIKTLNLRLIQTGYYTEGDYYQSRAADITISTPPYWSPVLNTIISYTETINVSQGQVYNPSIAPWPIDYEQSVSFNQTSNRFIFQLIRAPGSTEELKQTIKGIYTLY